MWMPEISLSGVGAADDGLNPVVRTVINNIVSKRFDLTKAEVSGLTIEEKARLLKSTFSEAEIIRLLEEEVNRFFAPFKSLLHLCFPALAEFEKDIAHIDDTVDFYFNLIFFPAAGAFSLFGFYVIAQVLAKRCHASAKWLVDIGFPSFQHHANSAAQWLLNKVFPSSQHGVARLTNNAAQQSSGSAQVSDATQKELSVLPDSSLNTLAKRCHTSAKWLVDKGFPSFQHHANAAAQWLWNRVFPSSQHSVARLTNDAAQVTNDAAQVADDAAQGLLVAPSESSPGFSVVLENVNMQALEHLEEN